MNSKRNVFIVVAVFSSLGACGPSRHLEITDPLFGSLGGLSTLPAEMRNRHLAGVVSFDETWAGNYHRVSRNVLYMQGVREGTPEYDYRVVQITLHNPQSFLWRKAGSLPYFTAALVPDHFPRLKAGDTVEIRQNEARYNSKNFSETGEGNIVVRILCQKASPDYKECTDNGPRVGEFRGVGETGTPYPASVAEYGFTFTPWFTADGQPLRDYPEP